MLTPRHRNALGARGEAIFSVLLTDFHPGRGPLFKPGFLGDKWEYLDYFVELEDTGLTPAYFFVQVRTTRQGYTRRDGRLRVGVSEEHLRRLAAYPAPTYVVGIDEVLRTGYLLAASTGNIRGLPSLTVAYPINEEIREALWNEVRDFWSQQPIPTRVSRFTDPDRS